MIIVVSISVGLLLSCVSGRANQSQDDVSMNPYRRQNGNELIQGDIILTSEQRGALEEKQVVTNTDQATTRQYRPSFVIKKWKLPIMYKFDKRYNFKKRQKRNIIKGMEMWQNDSCITFKEALDNYTGPYLNFAKKRGCQSYIGRTSNQRQDIFLGGSNCLTLAGILHEIGHALGLIHEHNRPNRNKYVKIRKENIIPGLKRQFERKYYLKDYPVPYDYTSRMHYKSTDFSKNRKPTIVARDVFFDRLIGRGKRLSFFDIAKLNLAYSCSENCSSVPDCYNGGFVNAACQCICPPGTNGSACENITGSYYGRAYHYGGKFQLKKCSPPLTIELSGMEKHKKKLYGIWLVEAEEGDNITVFVEKMQVFCGTTESPGYLSIRTGKDVHLDTFKGCNGIYQGETFNSTTKVMVLTYLFNGRIPYWFQKGNFVGFSVNVSVIAGDDCR